MFDLTSVVYSALIIVGTYIAFRVIDTLLDHFLEITVFRRIWRWLSKEFKKFLTRLRPIKTSFQFAVRVEANEPSKIKEALIQLIETISKKYQEQIKFSSLTWADDDTLGSTNVSYNEWKFEMNMHIAKYYDYEPEQEVLIPHKNAKNAVSDGTAFSIEANFPFYQLDQMLLTLGALTNLIREELKEICYVEEFSKGMFVITPIKGDFTMDHWIKEKQFDVSLLLKAREKVLVNLYPKKAEVIFPTMQIDNKVSEYLRATILNYYL